MKHITGKKSKENSMWTSILIGIVCSLLVSFIGVIIITFLINKESFGLNTGGGMSAVIWFGSSFAGAAIACKFTNRQYFIVSAVTALGYLLILAGMQIMFFDSQFYQIWKGILAALAGILPCILLFGRTSGRKKGKIKYRPV